MCENDKNYQLSDDQLESVGGGNAPTIIVHSWGGMKPQFTSQSELINKAMEQSKNNIQLSAEDNIQPATEIIRDTELET